MRGDDDSIAQVAVHAPPTEQAAAVDHRYRPDIEGLRAVAVLAVLLFHLGVPGFDGGYVGVDVFFVISGFLITRGLFGSYESRGRVSFADFYARRARRILPASTLVLVATLVGAALFQNPLYQEQTGQDARAAALFVSNFRFAAQATDYFQNDALPSPLQNYWTLSLEEQFYFLWPAVLAIAVVVFVRLGSARRRALAALVIVSAVSFAASVTTSGESSAAYFLLLPRAWELAAGAILALVLTSLVPLISRTIARCLCVGGLVAIAVAVHFYDETTVFPGWAAALPVGGAVAVVVAGAVDLTGPGAWLLSLRPSQLIGRYSYSLYLWHWPVLVLATGVYESIGADWIRGAFVTLVVTVPAVLISYHFVENPIRFNKRLQANNRASLLLGLAMVVGVVLVTFVYSAVTQTGRLATGDDAAIEGQYEGELHTTDHVPPNLVPALGDESSVELTDCGELGDCRYGTAGGTTVVALGDSHTAHWRAGLEGAAELDGFDVLQRTHGACGSFLYTPLRASESCDAWRSEVFEDLRADPPEILVLSNYSLPQYRDDPAEWERGIRETFAQVPSDTSVVVLGETPDHRDEVPTCLAEHLGNTKACETKRLDELEALNERLEQITTSEGGQFVDVASWMCDDSRCPVVIGNVLVFRDKSHMTHDFALTRSEALAEALSGT